MDGFPQGSPGAGLPTIFNILKIRWLAKVVR